jgi:hypothetical protein
MITGFGFQHGEVTLSGANLSAFIRQNYCNERAVLPLANPDVVRDAALI